MYWSDQTSTEILSGFYKKLGKIFLCFSANNGSEIVDFLYIGNKNPEEISSMIQKKVEACFTTSGLVTNLRLA